MTQTSPEAYLQEIIKLQLKKPKSWNWQLTTSKSSPHIALPIIQLYDAKGQLLIQTDDNGKTKRRSWHSSDVQPRELLKNILKQRENSRRIQKSKSDTLDFSRNNNNNSVNKDYHRERLEYINKQRERSQERSRNTLRKSQSSVLGNSISRKIADVTNECGKPEKNVENTINPHAACRKILPHLQKSRSAVLEIKERSAPPPNSFSESFKRNSLQTNNNSLNEQNKNEQLRKPTRHRRSRSDDLFRRKLKYNEESIKRAEIDGYRNFITPIIPDKFRDKSPFSKALEESADVESETEKPSNRKERKKRQRGELMTAENVLLPNNSSNIEVHHFVHTRYKTRTSSAGTLIIPEELGSSNRRRRRRRDTNGDEAASIERTPSNTKYDDANFRDKQNNLFKHDSGIQSSRSTTSKLGKAISPSSSRSHHVRQVSDPTGSRSTTKGTTTFPSRLNVNRYMTNGDGCEASSFHTNATNSKENIRNRDRLQRSFSDRKNNLRGDGLFYSQSDRFIFQEIQEVNCDENRDDNCNYIVQEIITPTSDNKSRKNSGPMITEKLEKKKRRKTRSRYSEGSTSSSDVEGKSRHKRKEFGTKARVVKEHPGQTKRSEINHKSSGGGGVDEDELLQLVRKLSNSDHVKMGANVSRHSSKGLSGRRSQSSGSICNGKGGRHNKDDGKMCGSLPSYLDDTTSNGCNNNHHDCEKPPIDEVQRIPPLGDGAPLHWKFSDTQTALCDQGYGSERSPEEEYPPPLPDHDSQCHHHLEPHACYPFITPESTFSVKLSKGSRGLGLSVTGGIDSAGSWPGLIRIKRLFPHQPASQCGLLNVGDLLLEANGITLTGLTNYEALEVLRTAPNQVELKICRPPPDVLSCVSPISEVPPPPPRREPPSSLSLPPQVYTTPEDEFYHGEFEVTLTKIQGSLGFTLRKEDDSALGHYVRALVREPALTDGRIRAGDKIIAVNEVEISPMSHEQAVQFLRQCGDLVKLRLYRDSAQTPVAALSPTETTPRTSFTRKAHLRQEAMDMLNDIAVRKLIPGNQQQDTCRRSQSPTASPRRLRRHPCPSDASQMTDHSTTYILPEEQFHEGLLQNCNHPFDEDAFNSLFIMEGDDDRPSRPSSLDLYNPNQTPVAARKPRFNFSLAHNAYELNNLDAEVLDAPNLTYNLGNDDVKSTEVECGDSFPQEPVSMPHIPIDNPGFSYKNPAYQSAHPCCGGDNNEEKPCTSKSAKQIDDNTMKKWKKNVALDGYDERHHHKPPAPKPHKIEDEYDILAIELNRGWNSRLGFSLQGAAGVTYVSAVHSDSVAARDGRLKPGDRVIKVNDESVENMNTSEIIDLLRIVRGPVCIVVSRAKSNEDCPMSKSVK